LGIGTLRDVVTSKDLHTRFFEFSQRDRIGLIAATHLTATFDEQ
jgi:hypothetical protein